MNIASSNSQCEVVSKFFTGNTVMDESLTDFKKKKSFQGPKNVKAAAPKPRAKKAVKRIKGQKDIRTALKPKKNELIAYSKDFDNICKKSGIDVDSEQLQLAIALSKSLQATESINAPSTSQPLSAQQRTGHIRTTLKEYGFKVPEVKPCIHRKIKKRRKSYQLLLTNEDQKQQIISDKYSQLLFELNNTKITSRSPDLDTSTIFLYNMATNIEYGDIKDDDAFYVEDLIEKSPNTMGCLLKDWSNIPGRLTSPMQEKSELVFSEIECSQDEVDVVLSGSLKSSKEILKKRNLYRRKTVCIDNQVIDKTHEEIVPVMITCDDNNISSEVVTVVSDSINTTVTKDNSSELLTVKKKQVLTITQQCRSLSPDLFDDDDDTIVEIAEESPVKLITNVTKEASTIMDLTECVNVVSQNSINSYYRQVKQALNLSQDDVTKRKSNDFMEMTVCVGVSSQPIKEIIEEHIDLTIPCRNDRVLEAKRICSENVNSVEHMDLTQSSNSSNESLPYVHISGKERVQEKSLDDTVILNDNDYQEVNNLKINTGALENINIDVLNDNDDKHHSCAAKLFTGSDEIIKIRSAEDFVDIPKDATIIDLDASHINDKVEDNIDLTQTSKSNESDICSPVKNTHHFINNSSLGKKDDVSVDYDEALENMNCYTDYEYDLNFNGDNSVLEGNNLDTSKREVQFDNNRDPETVKLPESEFKSSNRDTEHNFDIGGISVINDLQSFNRGSRDTLNVPNGSMRDSLPMVDIGGTEVPPKPKPQFVDFPDPVVDHSELNDKITKTPINEANIKIAVTPKQSEYIVRTDNITPMADYAAMTSPERNKELDKYGLKPFKRKRAIQLLTHLYNQTHPFVESTQELTSPSKKRKIECPNQPSTSKSPRKVKSPKKNSKLTSKNGSEGSGSLNVSDKENDMFMVTSEVPAFRDIECDADDWVFQKREKAKLHSCRLPLHIAFHNFVSCRRLLHEAILRYEPVNIDVIHKELAASGHRYDPKDLLKFMDKKCITVKTADKAKNKNRY